MVGEHAGHELYTVGQRRGLGSYGSERFYVKQKDSAANELVVAPRGELLAGSVTLSDGGVLPPVGEVAVKVRSRGTPVPARLLKQNGRASLDFRTPLFAPAPGQYAVFYEGARVVGWAEIEEAFREGQNHSSPPLRHSLPLERVKKPL